VNELVDALAKLPPTGGIVLRGLDGPAQDVPALGVLTEVVAASRDVLAATENFTVRTLLVLLTRSGRDVSALSAHRDDGEVLLLPGSPWRRLPDPVVPGAPVPVVALEELDPTGYCQPDSWPATLADLADAVAALVRTEPGAVAAVTRPGYFAGPWPTRTRDDGWT